MEAPRPDEPRQGRDPPAEAEDRGPAQVPAPEPGQALPPGLPAPREDPLAAPAGAAPPAGVAPPVLSGRAGRQSRLGLPASACLGVALAYIPGSSESSCQVPGGPEAQGCYVTRAGGTASTPTTALATRLRTRPRSRCARPSIPGGAPRRRRRHLRARARAHTHTQAGAGHLSHRVVVHLRLLEVC